MANNSPTIVAASLSDDQLKKSIDSLVTYVDKAMKKMVQSTNNAVGEMEAKLKSLGNLKIDSGGTNDGGASKRTKAQNAETDAVEKTIAARDKQIKKNQEAAMSFDQIAAALDKAKRTVSDFNTKRASGILPSSEDYKRYEQSLARIVEYNDKLKSSAMAMATANEKWFGGFNAKRVNEIFFPKDNGKLAAMSKYYADLEQQSQKTAQSAQRYTEEIRKQAQAIRESQQWKEKGFVAVDGNVFSNQENIAKKKRISLEEQILNLQQNGIYLSQNQTTKEWQLVDASGRRVAFIQQENENLAKQRERVAEIANDVRRLFADGSFGKISFTPSPLSGVRYIYQENDERSKGLTIEQQIEKILKEQSAEYERQASAKKASNNGSQRTLNDLQSQARAIEELLEKGKRVKALGGFEFIPADMSGQTVMQQIISYQEQRKAGLLAENQALNLQLELSNAIAQAQGRIAQEQEKRKKYVSPTINDDAYQITRNAIARKLGIDTSKVINADAQYDSIKRVGNALKQLQDAYTRMSNEERNSPVGKQMIRQMQELERQTQQLRAQMSRPISLKDALGGSEKTLDDIAYKMRQLASYRSGLNVETQTKEIDQVNRKYAELQKKMNDIMQKNTDMIASNTALGRSWNYMKNRLAFYFTVGAGTSFIKQLIDIRSQYELLERSIGILFDSMQTGSKIFSELNAMAIKSPFTTMELGAAAKQLSAYNIAAKDVVDTTRRLADIAAAVGIPIERLTYALGQIKSYGYLNSRDARMFANAGIPLIQNLADMYTKLEGRLVSIGDVYDRIKKKQISFEDTIRVVNEMTNEGGRFFNFQEKAADTLKVKLANLNLAYNNFLNELGKSNQGVLMGGLGAFKLMLENWRKLENVLNSVVIAFGLVKAAQVVYIATTQRVGLATAAADVASTGLVKRLYAVKAAMMSLAANPLTWVTVLASALIYLKMKYKDLQEENQNFNKALSDNAKENINSINKFVNDYKKDLESVGSMKESDQSKLWEKVREEIEKTSKNAKEYIELLESIPDIANRVTKASSYFEQEKMIQSEVKRLSDRGYFSVGGGFFDDSAADDLREYDEILNEVIRDYGSLEEFMDFLGERPEWSDTYNDLKQRFAEAELEMQKFVKTLDNANLDKIFGNGTNEEKFTNLRNFTNYVRDAFLATEKGQKIGAEGQMKLNLALDAWIDKTARANNLVNEQRGNIESNRSAWELFFKQLNEDDKKTVDYLIKTNQTGSEEFKKIWDKAAEGVKESSYTAYEQIQQQIAQLRNTPDIVINVVYRSTKENLDKQQQAFVDKWITPENWSARGLSAEEYLKEETENRTKYGRLMRKNDEDNVEWEKRLGQEYQDNEKAIKSLNNQLKDYDKLSEEEQKNANESMKQKVKERQLYKDLNKAIMEVGLYEGFNYDQFKKGGKNKADELAQALSKETQLVNKLTSEYDKLTKAGLSSADALSFVKKQFGGSIAKINDVLSKFGLQNLDVSIFKGKDPNAILNYFNNLKKQIYDKGLSNLKRLEPIEAIIDTVQVSARTYNLDMITKGLNNELSKLKDEYELAVELDADPELGNAFAEMFGIDRSQLPSNIYDYIQYMQDKADDAIQKTVALDPKAMMKPFDLLSDDINLWAKETGVDVNSELAKGLVSSQNQAKGAMKKYTTDLYNQSKDLQYKLADTNGKIAIEEEKLANLRERLSKETREKERENLQLQIQDQENAIAKLKESLLQELPAYKALFGGIAEHSAVMARRLANDYRTILDNAEKNAAGNFVIKQGNQTVELTESTYYKEYKRVNDELRKSASPLNKIKEAFTKGEDGAVDFWKGVELVNDEVKKLATLATEIGNFAQVMGFSEDTVEVINDVATSISGVATMTDGLGQIASGDYIGGAASMLSGLTSIIGAWADNSNKKIDAEIKSSERAVKRLELAYIDLERAINKAYGTGINEAKQAAAAAKKLELYELERQLRLEKSRDSKHRDEDRIIELQKQIKELKYEIEDMYRDVVDDLLGSDVGSFAENLVSAMAEAFKQGEDYMEVFNEKFDEMIDNMIIKSITSRIVASYLDKLWEDLNNRIKERSEKESDAYVKAQNEAEQVAEYSDYTIASIIATQKGYVRETSANYEDLVDKAKRGGVGVTWARDYWNNNNKDKAYYVDAWQQVSDEEIAAYKAMIEERKETAEKELKAATEIGDSDINYLMEEVAKIMPELGEKLKNIFGNYWQFGQDSEKTLSSLQQGIQGITEDTAGALEAYMNGVSQQVYLQSDLLTQIRDAVVGMDMDVQVATQAQMLLQLQQSYAVQMAIQGILEGWTNPSGQAVRVELLS